MLNSMRVPDYCSFAKVTLAEHRSNFLDGVITGGNYFGDAINSASAVKFVAESINAVDTINMAYTMALPDMQQARYMH